MRAAMNKLPLRLLLRLQRRPLPLLFLLFIFLSDAAAVNSPISTHDGVASGEEIWCVGKNNAEEDALQAALDWACGPGSADCRPIQDGGACFEPEDVQSHASYAFNDYFRRHGSSPAACDFSGTAAITGINPSHGDCKFPASSYASNGSFSGSSSGMSLPSSGSGCGWSLKLYVAVLAATATAGSIFQ
ncbi:Glucan endo-1,3-beta-glucosidase-like protein 1 [Platanthera zijinensis]|uniref:Glucan endo-1,3-beta-glucosidase-like protein 1 n=1 Tax=Platanthera zijinensis TaxID=2320716 RepID=A0AAP0BEX0_9ASPA